MMEEPTSFQQHHREAAIILGANPMEMETVSESNKEAPISATAAVK